MQVNKVNEDPFVAVAQMLKIWWPRWSPRTNRTGRPHRQ